VKCFHMSADKTCNPGYAYSGDMGSVGKVHNALRGSTSPGAHKVSWCIAGGFG